MWRIKFHGAKFYLDYLLLNHRIKKHPRRHVVAGCCGRSTLYDNQRRGRNLVKSCHGRKSPLQRRHNGRDGVSKHQPRDCFLNCLFRRRSKKTSKLRVTGLCVGNSPVTGEFPAQRANNAETVSIWWRHHVYGRMVGGIACQMLTNAAFW